MPHLLSSSLSPSSLATQKLFAHITLSRLLFFLKSNYILSPCQTAFRTTQSTLYQILCLSWSISDGFNKSKPGSRIILATNDFSEAFNSVSHPVLFRKIIFANLPPCFVQQTQSVLSDRRACLVLQ